MRALTEQQIEEMAKVLAHPLNLEHSLCPADIGLQDDKLCKGGDWSTACETCWKAQLQYIRIAEEPKCEN